MMAFIRPRLRKPLGIALAGTVFAAGAMLETCGSAGEGCTFPVIE
jgi:hypothetical protein